MDVNTKLALASYLDDLKDRYKEDPYTANFVFGSDGEQVSLRNGHIQICAPGPVTLLSAMLRLGLDETKRINLFPDIFDLGNPKSIPDNKLTLVHLAKKVRKERQLSDNPETRKKKFENITEKLRKITGRGLRDYDDKQNSLRVIYLLDRMMVNSSAKGRERSKRILTLIKAPATKFSFELRSDYPTLKSEANSHLLSDLKAYLSIEIDSPTLDLIDSVFGGLIDRIDKIRHHLDKVAHSPGSSIAGNYKALHSLVAAVPINLAIDLPSTPPRLDQDLYLHLHRIEFLNYVGEHNVILEKAEPPSPVKSVREEMIVALSAMANRRPAYEDITKDKYILSAFPTLAEKHAERFLNIIELALGFRPSEQEYLRIVLLSKELLYRTKIFGLQKLVRLDEVLINFRQIVSSLSAVAQALKFRTSYQSKLYGEDSGARSIITTLENPINFDGRTAPNEVPEGYLKLWHYRREWLQLSLEGGEDVARLKFGLVRVLWTKALECVSLGDISKIRQAVLGMETQLLRVTQRDVGY